MTYTALSLFTGVGGFDEAMRRAGFKIVAMVERDKYAASVLRYRYPDTLLLDDVRDVGAHNLPPVDVVMGGFPCQGFSNAGLRRGLDDPRSGLFFHLVRIVNELQPQVVFWENVPGLLTRNSGRDFGIILSAFCGIRYCGVWSVLDSQYFGVPQRRRRLFGVFVRENLGTEPAQAILAFSNRLQRGVKTRAQKGKKHAALNGDGVSGHRRVARNLDLGVAPNSAQVDMDTLMAEGPQAFDTRNGVVMPIVPPLKTRGNSLNGIAPIITATANQRDEWRLDTGKVGTLTAEPGMNGQTFLIAPQQPLAFLPGEGLISPLIADGENQAVAFTPRRGEFFGDGRIVPTLCVGTGGNGGPGVVQPDFVVRRLTPLECERLQAFMDGWTEFGLVNGKVVKISDTQRYKMLGNAVTVSVVEWQAHRIRAYLDGNLIDVPQDWPIGAPNR